MADGDNVNNNSQVNLQVHPQPQQQLQVHPQPQQQPQVHPQPQQQLQVHPQPQQQPQVHPQPQLQLQVHPQPQQQLQVHPQPQQQPQVHPQPQQQLQVHPQPQQQPQVHPQPQQQPQVHPQPQQQPQVHPQPQQQLQVHPQPQQQLQVHPQPQQQLRVHPQPQQQLQVHPQPQQQLQVHPQPQQQLQVHPQPQQQLQVQPQQQLHVQPQQQLNVQPQQQLHVQPQQQLHVQPQQQLQVQPQQQLQVQPQQQLQVQPQQQLQVQPQQQLQVQPQQQLQVQPELQLQSQPVRDLPGLLRAVTSIRGAAGTTNTEHSAMSAENQQWLMNALGELCCPSDDVQLMKQALALLEVEMSREKEESRSRAKNEEDEDVEEWDERVQRQERALDTLLEITEVVDYSRVDFCKLGGMNVVFTGPLLSSAPSLRHRAAELVAICAQNEPMVQSCVLSLGGLQTLLDLVDKDTNEVVRVKALLAVSCIVRESEVALHEFVEKDGCSLLLRSLQNESPRLRAKAAFLVHCLLRTRPHLQEDFIAMGTVQQLGMMLQDFHEPSHEHIAGALCCLASHPMGLAGCQESALGLEHALHSRISELGTNDQFQEEKEFCEHLMEIFAADSPSNGAMDR